MREEALVITEKYSVLGLHEISDPARLEEWLAETLYWESGAVQLSFGCDDERCWASISVLPLDDMLAVYTAEGPRRYVLLKMRPGYSRRIDLLASALSEVLDPGKTAPDPCEAVSRLLGFLAESYGLSSWAARVDLVRRGSEDYTARASLITSG